MDVAVDLKAEPATTYALSNRFKGRVLEGFVSFTGCRQLNETWSSYHNKCKLAPRLIKLAQQGSIR